MKPRARAASGAAREWSAERASFLDRLDLEVRALPAGGILQRLLGGEGGFAPVLPHHIALLERVGSGRNGRGIGLLQSIDGGQDVPELIAVADDLVFGDPQARQARDVLDFTGRKLGLGFAQDL